MDYISPHWITSHYIELNFCSAKNNFDKYEYAPKACKTSTWCAHAGEKGIIGCLRIIFDSYANLFICLKIVWIIANLNNWENYLATPCRNMKKFHRILKIHRNRIFLTSCAPGLLFAGKNHACFPLYVRLMKFCR